MNESAMHSVHANDDFATGASRRRKAWHPPTLDVLDIRSGTADEGTWAFVAEGDFWKRELLIS